MYFPVFCDFRNLMSQHHISQQDCVSLCLLALLFYFQKCLAFHCLCQNSGQYMHIYASIWTQCLFLAAFLKKQGKRKATIGRSLSLIDCNLGLQLDIEETSDFHSYCITACFSLIESISTTTTFLQFFLHLELRAAVELPLSWL